jgi:hypothetical protein
MADLRLLEIWKAIRKMLGGLKSHDERIKRLEDRRQQSYFPEVPHAGEASVFCSHIFYPVQVTSIGGDASVRKVIGRKMIPSSTGWVVDDEEEDPLEAVMPAGVTDPATTEIVRFDFTGADENNEAMYGYFDRGHLIHFELLADLTPGSTALACPASAVSTIISTFEVADTLNKFAGRARSKYSDPHDVGSRGLAKRRVGGDYQIVAMQPRATLLYGTVTTSVNSTTFYIQNVRVCAPAGGLIIDQDPAGNIRVQNPDNIKLPWTQSVFAQWGPFGAMGSGDYGLVSGSATPELFLATVDSTIGAGASTTTCSSWVALGGSQGAPASGTAVDNPYYFAADAGDTVFVAKGSILTNDYVVVGSLNQEEITVVTDIRVNASSLTLEKKTRTLNVTRVGAESAWTVFHTGTGTCG